MPSFTPEQLMTEADRLFAYALKRVGDRHRAEDLVQDALLAAWESRDRFDGRSKLSTWLVGIMKYKILDHFRAKKRVPTENAVDPMDPDDWGDDPLDRLFDAQGSWRSDPNYAMGGVLATPAEEAERSDIMQHILACLEHLPERLRLLFSLREIEMLSVEETAAAAGVTPGSAAVLLTRARHQLRACLQRRRIEPA